MDTEPEIEIEKRPDFDAGPQGGVLNRKGSERRLERMPNDRGALNRSGRPKGAVSLITRTFREFAAAMLDDPEVQDRIRERFFAELDGKRSNPLPTLAVLVAVSNGKRPAANEKVTFVAQIEKPSGEVDEIELAKPTEADAV